jgi:hypothetical protein
MRGGGRIPKRSSEIMGHRTKADLANRAFVGMPVAVVPPPCPEGIHPVAVKWYESLKTSGQHLFYEDSDWALAVFTAHQMSLCMKFPTASAFKSILDACDRLLVTEGARRRVRIEVERPDPHEGAEKPKEIDDYRSRLTTESGADRTDLSATA